MDLLIDTHAVIWFITDDKLLSRKAKNAIEDPNNICFVSTASLWEMSIKHSLGKLKLNENLESMFMLIEQSGFQLLPIFPNHLLKNARLESYHRDPFDRLIIAQAITENFTIITKDALFSAYRVDLLW